MTKKIFLAIAMFLVTLLLFAQSDSTRHTSMIITDGKNVITATRDTLMVVTEANETIQAMTNDIAPWSEHYAEIVTANDNNYILHGKYAYRLDDLEDLVDSVKDTRDPFFDDSEQEMMVPILAICFGIPCLTLIIALVLLLMFFLKKTQARNAIIGKAIDANYQLPDAFFSNPQSSSQSYDEVETGDGHTADQTKKEPRMRRDPKNFSSAVTLLAVGLALILFFASSRHWEVAFLAGGIPFFLGVGKLIGYYYVPGLTSENKKGRANNNYPPQQPPYGGYPNQPYRNMPPQNQYPGSYPPPFNHDRNENSPR